ncbi:hypothetical protein D9613_003731 [Agrocybe pediades]|uniref:Uncharacterized protein n=1 Tax=Agrocybe pediades TaxID=84607 RepID=A0A8H4VI94_9AGAR|nr:hypothetical protein D9613_003731 [Agrocybe pediades]
MDAPTLTNSSSWGPIGEASSTILADDLNLIASTTINGMAYGVSLPLFFICFQELLRRVKSARAQRHQIFFTLGYIFLLFLFATLYIATDSYQARLAYVNNRNYPLGEAAYDQAIFFLPVSVMGLFAYFAVNWLTDAIMIWRLYIVYGGGRMAKFVTALPALIFLASFATSCATLNKSISISLSFWTDVAPKFVLAYYSITIAFTILCTILLVGRLLYFRHQTRKVLGSSSTSHYLGVAAMIVESAALYTVWGILFLVLYIINNPAQYLFLASLASVQTIALLLIVIRVNRGTAWQRNTTLNLSTEAFGGSTARNASGVNLKMSVMTTKDSISNPGKSKEFGTESDLVAHDMEHGSAI